MLPGLAGMRGPIIGPNTTIYEVIQHLNLESSLQWVIDAGDVRSISNANNQTLGTLPPGGITWTRGPDTSVDNIRDPQFVGTIGGQSVNEYWDVGRGHGVAATSFRRFESPIASWSNAMHQDGATFTLAGWFRKPSTMDGGEAFGTIEDASHVGVSLGATFSGLPPAGRLYCSVGNGSGSFALQTFSTMTVPVDQAVFLAWAMNETGNALLFQRNATQETVAGAYTSPSAGASTFSPIVTMSTNDLVAGRVYNASLWNRPLSAAELLGLFNATRGKFGI